MLMSACAHRAHARMHAFFSVTCMRRTDRHASRSSLDHVRVMHKHQVKSWLNSNIKEAATPSAAPTSGAAGSASAHVFVGLEELDGQDIAELCLLGRSPSLSLSKYIYIYIYIYT